MLTEIRIFIFRHWLHALLCLPGAIAVTVLHEAAHAFAAWVQGGEILEFAWLPWASKGHWGYVRYEFPTGAGYSEFAIAAAPYFLWFSMAALAHALSFRRISWGHAAGSTVFFWMYVVPLADVANAAIPWLAGGENDFTGILGHPSGLWFMLIALVAFYAVRLGYGMQQRLYGTSCLSLPAYRLLCIVTLAALVLLTLG